MTPLQKQINKSKTACCQNCKNTVMMYGAYYCANSGKMLLKEFMDSVRADNCNGRFKKGRISK